MSLCKEASNIFFTNLTPIKKKRVNSKIYSLIFYRTISFKTLPVLNAGVFCLGILISSPVRGLRPVLATLVRISNVPKPEITTFSPVSKVSEIVSNNVLTTSSVAFLVKSTYI